MKAFVKAGLLLFISTVLFSCSLLQQQKMQEPAQEATKEKEEPPLYLGSVHQVFQGDKFALLRIIGPMPSEGTVLITHPADGTTDRMGNLIVSSAGSAGKNIIAADIRSGFIMKGDLVFKYRSISAEEDTETEEENPEPETLTGTEIDTSFRPRDVEEKLQRVRKELAEESTPEYIQDAQTPADTPAMEEPEPAPAEPIPSIPSTRGNLDDIPDTIGGWDAI